MQHYLASPSSSDRWIRCTGSLHLLSQYPQPFAASPQAEYGTQVHDLARLFIGQPWDMKRQLAELYLDTNGYTRQQMQEALSYSDYVDDLVTKCDSPQVSIEKKICIPSVDAEMFGTPDVIVYQPPQPQTAAEGTLHIVDLKTGRIPVPAEYNSQLLLYAQGAIDTYRYDPQYITLHIYQDNDRCGPNTNVWTVTKRYLREFTKLVSARFNLYRQRIYSYQVGEHCRYCPVRQHCTSFSQQHTHALESLASEDAVTISNASPQALAALYRSYKHLQPFIESIEARLLETAPEDLEGTQVTIRNRKAPLAYEDSTAALEALLSAGADLDTVAPRVLISPSRLRAVSEDLFTAVSRHVSPQGSTSYISLERKKSKQLFD